MAEELENVMVKTITAQCGHEIVYRHDHILHYMNEEVYGRCLSLSQEDKDRFFQMITQYGDILSKILDDPNHPILDTAMGLPWVKLESSVEDTNQIDYTKPEQLLNELKEWKSKQPK
mgnify:CR=1 FL=1|jgi:hypothetical protein